MQEITKAEAIALLGGSARSAARAIGCTVQAVSKWPEVLSPRVADRVMAAQVRLKANTRKRKASTKTTR